MVQQLTEKLDREVKTEEIYDSLISNYIVDSGPYKLVSYDLLSAKEEGQRCVAKVEISESLVTIDGEGSGPIEAFVNAMADTLNEPIVVIDYREHSLGTGTDAHAICVLAIEDNVNQKRFYGIGLSRNTITASLSAIVSALNRRWNA
jgi:2-isopropylmalate synthase